MISERQEDLLDTPLDNLDVLLFCDRTYTRNFQGNIITGYVIFSSHEVLEAFLPAVKSVQSAKLTAVTRACTLAKGKTAIIYTDSR